MKSIPTTLLSLLSTALLGTLPSATAQSQPQTSNTPGMSWGTNANTQACASQGISAQWRDQIISNYLNLWNGPDFSYLNNTLSENVIVSQDRLPTGTGNGSFVYPITNYSSFESFVGASRDGFSNFTFVNTISFGYDNLVALRWRLDAVANGTGQTANIAEGTNVSYNGTDIYVLDRCTGLVDQIILSQDFIDYFYQLQTNLGIL